MYSVIGPEPKFRTQLIYQAAAIMNEAGHGLDHASHARVGTTPTWPCTPAIPR
jgi:hypothetical protein